MQRSSDGGGVAVSDSVHDAFLTIINAGRFVQSEMLIHHAITQTAKQISAYGYVLTKTNITDQMISTNNKSSKFKTDASNTVDSVKNFSNSVSDFTTTGDLQSVIDSGNAPIHSYQISSVIRTQSRRGLCPW